MKDPRSTFPSMNKNANKKFAKGTARPWTHPPHKYLRARRANCGAPDMHDAAGVTRAATGELRDAFRIPCRHPAGVRLPHTAHQPSGGAMFEIEIMREIRRAAHGQISYTHGAAALARHTQ